MAYRRQFGREINTGRMAERDLLGEVRGAVEWEKWRDNHEYMTDGQAYADVIERQPGDPTEPPTDFTRQLKDYVSAVLEQLDLGDCDDIGKRLRFYTAVGSHFDYSGRLGVDAFFEFDDKSGTIRVTIGVSTYRKDYTKTDVDIVYPIKGLDPEVDREEWDELIKQAATEIATVIYSHATMEDAI